jgi:hypothetical protein
MLYRLFDQPHDRFHAQPERDQHEHRERQRIQHRAQRLADLRQHPHDHGKTSAPAAEDQRCVRIHQAASQP